VFFDKSNRLQKITGDVEVGDADDLSAPVSRNRVVDLGSLPVDGSAPPMPPPEGPGFFESLMKSVGW
jgi:outer membrane protein assembly factor BamE